MHGPPHVCICSLSSPLFLLLVTLCPLHHSLLSMSGALSRTGTRPAGATPDPAFSLHRPWYGGGDSLHLPNEAASLDMMLPNPAHTLQLVFWDFISAQNLGSFENDLSLLLFPPLKLLLTSPLFCLQR